MNINIYYGGRGLLDDPTLYVVGKMEDVLRELRVQVKRYNIFEHKTTWLLYHKIFQLTIFRRKILTVCTYINTMSCFSCTI